MALYMLQFSYTADAWATLTRNPQDRSIPIKEMMRKLNGRFVSFYYCFGEYDGVLLYEAPDDGAAMSASLAALAPGHIKEIKTTRLFSVEETMEAMRRADSLSFSAPSKG